MKSPAKKEPTSGSGAAASADKDKTKPQVPKPKRPLSGYNYFFRFERAKMLGLDPPVTSFVPGASCSGNPGEPKKRRHRKAHGKIGFRDMATIISARWRFLDPNSRAYFESLAAADLQRYTRERELYNASVGNASDPKKPIKRVKRRGKLMGGGARQMGSFPFPPQHDYEAASRVISPFVRPAAMYGSRAATQLVGGGYSPANFIQMANWGAKAGFAAATAPMPPACISASTSFAATATATMPPPCMSMNLDGSMSLYPTRNPAGIVAQEHQNHHVMVNTNAAAAAPNAYACIPGLQHALGTGGPPAPPSHATAVVVPSMDPSCADVNMATVPQALPTASDFATEGCMAGPTVTVSPEPLLPEQGVTAIHEQQQQIDGNGDCNSNDVDPPHDDDVVSVPPSQSPFEVHKRNQLTLGKEGHADFTMAEQAPKELASQPDHGRLEQQQRHQQTPRPVEKSKFLATASGNVDSLLSALYGDGEGDILDFLSDLTASAAPAPEGKEEKKDEKLQHQYDKIFDFEQQAAKSTFDCTVSKAMGRGADCCFDEFSPLDFRGLASPPADNGGAGGTDDNNDMADLLSFAGIAA